MKLNDQLTKYRFSLLFIVYTAILATITLDVWPKLFAATSCIPIFISERINNLDPKRLDWLFKTEICLITIVSIVLYIL